MTRSESHSRDAKYILNQYQCGVEAFCVTLMSIYRTACQAKCLQLLLFVWSWTAVHGLKHPRVAIIGAGIGGSTAAHFLREELGHSVQLDM